MDRIEIEAKIKEFISDLMEIPIGKINNQDNLCDNLGMDEMDEVDFCMQIEDFFNISIDPDETQPLHTVQQMIDYVEFKVN